MMCYADDLRDGCQDLHAYILCIYICVCVCNINIHCCTYNYYHYIYIYTCVCVCVCVCVFQFDSSLHWFQSRMNLVNGIVKSNDNSWASWLEPGVQDMVLRTWPKLGQVYDTAQEMTLRVAQGFCLPLLSTNLVLHIGPPVHPLVDQTVPYFPYVWRHYQATVQGTLAMSPPEPRSRFLDFVSSCPRLPPGSAWRQGDANELA